MPLAACLGTWAGAGLMTGAYSSYGSVLLGVALMLYALSGVSTVRWSWHVPGALAQPRRRRRHRPDHRRNRVFVIPAVPYLQAIGLENDELVLVQALGLAFTLSTLALAGNLAAAGLSGAMLAPACSLASFCACGSGRPSFAPSSSLGCSRSAAIWPCAGSSSRQGAAR